VEEIESYRTYVDQQMLRWLSENEINESQIQLIELGLQHEQQHQELLITDLKYNLSFNEFDVLLSDIGENDELKFNSKEINIEKGIYEIGFNGDGFCFDNELNRHKVYLNSLDWTSAIYCLRYLLKLQPDNNIAKKRLAEVLVLKGQEILCQDILESKKRQSNGYELSSYIRAKLLFDEAFKHYKNMAHVWVLKAVCLVVEKQYTEALNCVKRAYACEQAKSLSHEVIILKAKFTKIFEEVYLSYDQNK
jgi:tetratricopeptide (TPR) repeat protein